MKVSDKKIASAAKVAALGRPVDPAPVAKPFTLPAPVRGLVTNQSLAASDVDSAILLENWFPERESARLRAGQLRHATLPVNLVASMFAYKSATVTQFFAVSDGNIYNVTSPANSTSSLTPVVEDLTGNDFVSVQFSTAGGEYLPLVNGADEMLVYDGDVFDASAVTFPTTPIDYSSKTTALFNHVTSFKNRLFFVEKDSKDAWYLPIDSIGGEILKLSLNGIFKLGGSLLFIETWSLDAGDGIDDKCVFVSDLGEAAVYEGSNPSNSTDWRLVGVYQITKPLGNKATMEAGGDLVIATSEGLVPISQAINKDPAALSLSAVSRAIEPDWKDAAQSFNSRGWHIAKWDAKNLAMVCMPGSTIQVPQDDEWGSGVWGSFIWGGGTRPQLLEKSFVYVVNIETGAWCVYTNIDAQCSLVVDDQLYIGTTDGRILAVEQGGSDDGENYLCRYASSFNQFDDGMTKVMRNIRSTFQFSQPFISKTSISTDYRLKWPSAPNAEGGSDGIAIWDTAVWDTAKWDAKNNVSTRSGWKPVHGVGFAVSVQIQVNCGSDIAPDATLVTSDGTYEVGGLVN